MKCKLLKDWIFYKPAIYVPIKLWGGGIFIYRDTKRHKHGIFNHLKKTIFFSSSSSTFSATKWRAAQICFFFLFKSKPLKIEREENKFSAEQKIRNSRKYPVDSWENTSKQNKKKIPVTGFHSSKIQGKTGKKTPYS